ncbi:NYN domain-containing protein [Leptolyngbya sp. DQ-M1]|uniref:NYN domain-containing protein n=1 Tax=Leptolyngbya sp. DQ-M1 TaxID=2933920 RepID=UPI0032987F15
MSNKVAIFLDVENLSGWLKSEGGSILLQQANALGQVMIQRAYGDFSNAAISGRQEDLINLGFELVHVYHPVKGKNAADIQMVVDVMEMTARSPDISSFVLATSDADFSPLFRRLKSLGKRTIGIGRESVLSRTVQNCCDRFIYIDADKTLETAVDPQAQALKLLKQALSGLQTPTTLSLLKAEMLKQDPTFDHSKLGYGKFLKFVENANSVVKLELIKKKWLVHPVAENVNIVSLTANSKKSKKKAS